METKARLDTLLQSMKPVEILKDLSQQVAIYPLADKQRIDELLLLDKVTIVLVFIGNRFHYRLSGTVEYY